MASCLLITAILCVLITTVATIVAFTTPNWLTYSSALTGTICSCPHILSCDCGLWLYCSGKSRDLENCRWYFHNEYEIERTLPVWFKAVQGLVAAAVVSSLMALLVGLCSLCCFCKNCSLHHVASGFINFTFLLLAAGMCTFAAKAHLEEDAQVVESLTNLVIFGWSFWTGVGATGMALISTILYFGIGRSDMYRAI